MNSPTGKTAKAAPSSRFFVLLALCALALAAAAALSSCGTAQSTITVALESQGGTGYVWTYEAEPGDVLTETGHETEAANDLAGGTVVDTYTFKAQKAGDVTLTLTLARPWEGADGEAQTVQYTFMVDEAKDIELDSSGGTYPNIPEPTLS